MMAHVLVRPSVQLANILLKPSPRVAQIAFQYLVYESPSRYFVDRLQKPTNILLVELGALEPRKGQAIKVLR